MTRRLDIRRFSNSFATEEMNTMWVDDIYRICLSNPQFYRYCETPCTKEQIIADMQALPAGKTASDKYYVGFLKDGKLIAVLDLIDGYPDEKTAFIGFFMMDAALQNSGTGSAIVSGLCTYLQEMGFIRVRLCINKGNPQSNHFWHKNGFKDIKEVERDRETVILAEKNIV